MQLASDWKKILKRAWSIRFMVLAFIFSVVEIALPFLEGLLPIPTGVFAILAGLSSGGAFITRLIAQKNMESD